jgi:drug/metabolite transporter (DMT)-like permease
MESVFAALAGAIFLKENLGLRGYIGCLLIFIAIVLAQLPEEWFKLKRK